MSSPSDPTPERSRFRARHVALICLLAGLLAYPFANTSARPYPQLSLVTWNVGTLDPFSLRLPWRMLPRVARTLARERPRVITLQEVASTAQVASICSLLRSEGLDYTASVLAVDPEHPDGLAVTLSLAPPDDVITVSTRSGTHALAVTFPGITVVNVHAPASSPSKRRLYFEDLRSWIATRSEPVVLAGDFNLSPRYGAGLAAILPWLRRIDKRTYADLAAVLPVRTSARRTTAYFLALDHVMATGGDLLFERVLRGQRRFPMDHDPTSVELTPARNSARGLVGAIGAEERTRPRRHSARVTASNLGAWPAREASRE